jgi:hypothetical protein
MAPSDVAKLMAPALILACGAALLSYRFYAVYRGWSLREFSYGPHLPGILGIALMVFAVLFASSLGWPHVIVAVFGGFAVAYFYVYVFRMRIEAALLGPVLAVLLLFLLPASFWA